MNAATLVEATAGLAGPAPSIDALEQRIARRRRRIGMQVTLAVAVGLAVPVTLSQRVEPRPTAVAMEGTPSQEVDVEDCGSTPGCAASAAEASHLLNLGLVEPEAPHGFILVRSHIRYWAPATVGPDQSEPIVDFNQTWAPIGRDLADPATPYIQLRRRAVSEPWDPKQCGCGPVVTTTEAGVSVAGRLGETSVLEWEERGVHFVLAARRVPPQETLRVVASLDT